DEKQLDKLLAVRSYLESHWEAIKPLRLRHLGVTSGVGTCEGGIAFTATASRSKAETGANLV
ncbi:hypothetical protein ABPS01_10010, partial [Streptococcus sp. ZJ151]